MRELLLLARALSEQNVQRSCSSMCSVSAPCFKQSWALTIQNGALFVFSLQCFIFSALSGAGF